MTGQRFHLAWFKLNTDFFMSGRPTSEVLQYALVPEELPGGGPWPLQRIDLNGRPAGKFPALPEFLCTLRRPEIPAGSEDVQEHRLIEHLKGRLQREPCAAGNRAHQEDAAMVEADAARSGDRRASASGRGERLSSGKGEGVVILFDAARAGLWAAQREWMQTSGPLQRLASRMVEQLDRAERDLEEVEAALHAPHST